MNSSYSHTNRNHSRPPALRRFPSVPLLPRLAEAHVFTGQLEGVGRGLRPPSLLAPTAFRAQSSLAACIIGLLGFAVLLFININKADGGSFREEKRKGRRQSVFRKVRSFIALPCDGRRKEQPLGEVGRCRSSTPLFRLVTRSRLRLRGHHGPNAGCTRGPRRQFFGTAPSGNSHLGSFARNVV